MADVYRQVLALSHQLKLKRQSHSEGEAGCIRFLANILPFLKKKKKKDEKKTHSHKRSV